MRARNDVPETSSALPLPGLESAVAFVDHKDATAAAHNATMLVARFCRFQRVNNFHALLLSLSARTLMSGARSVNVWMSFSSAGVRSTVKALADVGLVFGYGMNPPVRQRP